MNFDTLQNFIEPQLAILVPMLWGIGMAVKQSKIENRFIPIILLVMSCVTVRMYLKTEKFVFDSPSMYSFIFAAITQGSVIWLIAWFGYEKFLHKKN